MYWLLTLCLSSFLSVTKAPDLTVTWEEYSETRHTYYTKFCIIKVCGIYIGYAYDRDLKDGYCQTVFSASFNKRRGEFRGECMSFINRTTGHVLGIYNL